jgi:sec-independent protein translocase protein TatA
MFEDLGFEKILLILIVLFVLFGAKKIPELAQGLGKGIKEFKKAIKDTGDEIKKDTNDKNTDNKSV